MIPLQTILDVKASFNCFTVKILTVIHVKIVPLNSGKLLLTKLQKSPLLIHTPKRFIGNCVLLADVGRYFIS